MRALTLLLICSCFPVVGRADDDGGAREHFQRGSIAFDTGDFVLAVDEFKKSYAVKPKAATLFALGQAYRGHGDLALALRSYQLYLAKAPEGSYRDQVTTAINEVEREIAENRSTAPPHGVPPAAESARAPVATPPPAPAPQPRRSSDLRPFATTEGPPPPIRNPWYKSAAGWSLTGGGLTFAIVGAALLAPAASADDDARRAVTVQGQLDARQTAANYRTASYALLGIGGAAVIAGVVVFAVAGHSPKSKRVLLQLAPNPSGFALTLGGTL